MPDDAAAARLVALASVAAVVGGVSLARLVRSVRAVRSKELRELDRRVCGCAAGLAVVWLVAWFGLAFAPHAWVVVGSVPSALTQVENALPKNVSLVWRRSHNRSVAPDHISWSRRLRNCCDASVTNLPRREPCLQRNFPFEIEIPPALMDFARSPLPRTPALGLLPLTPVEAAYVWGPFFASTFGVHPTGDYMVFTFLASQFRRSFFSNSVTGTYFTHAFEHRARVPPTVVLSPTEFRLNERVSSRSRGNGTVVQTHAARILSEFAFDVEWDAGHCEPRVKASEDLVRLRSSIRFSAREETKPPLGRVATLSRTSNGNPRIRVWEDFSHHFQQRWGFVVPAVPGRQAHGAKPKSLHTNAQDYAPLAALAWLACSTKNITTFTQGNFTETKCSTATAIARIQRFRNQLPSFTNSTSSTAATTWLTAVFTLELFLALCDVLLTPSLLYCVVWALAYFLRHIDSNFPDAPIVMLASVEALALLNVATQFPFVALHLVRGGPAPFPSELHSFLVTLLEAWADAAGYLIFSFVLFLVVLEVYARPTNDEDWEKERAWRRKAVRARFRATDEYGREREPTTTKDKEEEPTCRICYCGETGIGPLVAPCLCTGTMRFCHAECLYVWISYASSPDSRVRCEHCQFPYNMQRTWLATVLRSSLAIHLAAFVPLIAVVLSIAQFLRVVDVFLLDDSLTAAVMGPDVVRMQAMARQTGLVDFSTTESHVTSRMTLWLDACFGWVEAATGIPLPDVGHIAAGYTLMGLLAGMGEVGLDMFQVPLVLGPAENASGWIGGRFFVQVTMGFTKLYTRCVERLTILSLEWLRGRESRLVSEAASPAEKWRTAPLEPGSVLAVWPGGVVRVAGYRAKDGMLECDVLGGGRVVGKLFKPARGVHLSQVVFAVFADGTTWRNPDYAACQASAAPPEHVVLSYP